MQKKPIFLLISALLLIFNIASAQDKYLSRKNINVKNFSSFVLGGPIDVVISLNNEEKLVLEGDEDVVATLVTEIKGNALIIRPEVSWTSWSHKYKGKKITAYISARELYNITLSGNGNIKVKDTFNQSSLSCSLSGSGNIALDVNVEKLKIVISGSGKVNISGIADEGKFTITGSGSIGKKTQLEVKNLNATISGSGKIYISSNGIINAVVSGSGKVYYSGNPEIKEKTFLGSGGVKPIED